MIKKGELIKRILVGIIGIPIIILLSLFGKIFFLLFISIIMIISFWEYCNFNSFDNKILYAIIGTVSFFLINFDMYISTGQNIHIIITLTVILITMLELFTGNHKGLINISVPVLGIVYIQFFTFYIAIREHTFTNSNDYIFGGYIILYIFAILWTFDISAYFAGSIWGKHTLYPRISPGKTWEGSILGLIAALLVSFLLNYFLKINLSIANYLIFTCVLCITAQISDLVESMYKRNSDIKDSSRILPGHGGIFDRFDGFFLSAPISYLMLQLFL